MKLRIPCTDCFLSEMENGLTEPPPIEISVKEVQENNLYEIVCRRGHKSFIVVQQQKFEILFQIGANAIVDGYYREALGSFTASLERFLEYFARASALQKVFEDHENIEPPLTPKYGGDANGVMRITTELVQAARARLEEYERRVSEQSDKIQLRLDEIDKAWASNLKVSERQLGAYVQSFLLETGKSPTLLTSKQTKFRNDVVHNGLIPTRAKVIEFGDAVLPIIREGIKIAKRSFPKGIDHLISTHLDAAHSAVPKGYLASQIVYPTIVSLSISDETHESQSLEEALRSIKR